MKCIECAVQDFIKHARSVKVYISTIQAVASMYSYIHLNYIEDGLQFLSEMNLSSTDELRARRHLSLVNYGQALSTELPAYTKTVSHPFPPMHSAFVTNTVPEKTQHHQGNPIHGRGDRCLFSAPRTG